VVSFLKRKKRKEQALHGQTKTKSKRRISLAGAHLRVENVPKEE
jgi:hypothetical protein